MAKFIVNVTETSYGSVKIVATSLEEARSKAEDEFHQGNVIWTSSDFKPLDVHETE